MTAEHNKALVRRFFAASEANDQAALNEVLAPDLVAYSDHAPDPQNREVHVQGISMFNAAFTDIHFTIEDQIAEGDKVATRATWRAIHNRGNFHGLPPTGKQLAVSGTTIERIKDGKIMERWVNADLLGMLQQLGLVPPPQPRK